MKSIAPPKLGFNDYKIIGDIAEIYAVRKNGDVITFLVDTEDIPKLLGLDYRWNASYNDLVKNYYAYTSLYYKDENGKRKAKRIILQNIIMNDKHIDHIDHDTKNNTKDNLRKTGYINNATNRKSKNSNNKSGYRNVFWDSKDERWMVVLQINKKSKCFGRFKYNDLEKAGALAEEMRQKHFREFAGNS